MPLNKPNFVSEYTGWNDKIATGHLIAQGHHHPLQHIQVHFGVDFQADFEDVSQPGHRHPPSIRRAPAGACGKRMFPVLDPYRGGD